MIIIQKKSRSLWKYCRDEPVSDDNDDILNFGDNGVTGSFKFKAKISGQIYAEGNENIKIPFKSKYVKLFGKLLKQFNQLQNQPYSYLVIKS